MENYKPNSFVSKEPQNNEPVEKKKVEKVINGPVKTNKKTGLQKIADSLKEDLPKVRNFILSDVIVPALKKVIVDSVNIFMYGEGGRGNTSNTAASKVSYRSYYNQNNNPGFRTAQTRTTYSYDDLIFTSRGEAELVLSQMEDILSRYRIVSVADLYDLVGITGSYTDHNYGWTDLHGAQCITVREGCLLKLPRALPIDK